MWRCCECSNLSLSSSTNVVPHTKISYPNKNSLAGNLNLFCLPIIHLVQHVNLPFNARKDKFYVCMVLEWIQKLLQQKLKNDESTAQLYTINRQRINFVSDDLHIYLHSYQNDFEPEGILGWNVGTSSEMSCNTSSVATLWF